MVFAEYGFCALLLAGTTFQDLLHNSTVQRTDAMAAAAAAAYDNADSASDKARAATVAALSQLWRFYSRPELLQKGCQQSMELAMSVLAGLGFVTRLMVYVLVKWKVMRKASE
jgi:hypothetical protein